MTYRVDAAVEAMKTPASHASRDCSPTQTSHFELPQRDDSMLPRSDRRRR
jgi:hypothetical protein